MQGAVTLRQRTFDGDFYTGVLVRASDAAVNKALAADLAEKLLADGLVPGGGSPADFAKFQADDIAASAKIIADKKISVD
jgi:hypothetical protein